MCTLPAPPVQRSSFSPASPGDTHLPATASPAAAVAAAFASAVSSISFSSLFLAECCFWCARFSPDRLLPLRADELLTLIAARGLHGTGADRMGGILNELATANEPLVPHRLVELGPRLGPSSRETVGPMENLTRVLLPPPPSTTPLGRWLDVKLSPGLASFRPVTVPHAPSAPPSRSRTRDRSGQGVSSRGIGCPQRGGTSSG